jgi:pimeloyl-ACP methyl ester carboxylesterase
MGRGRFQGVAAGLCLAATAACAAAGPPAAAPAPAISAPPAAAVQGPLSSDFASDRISVSTVGSGPDVVLIPGLSSSPAVWSGLVAAVPGYRFHLVQVKGFAGVPAEANASGPVLSPTGAEIARYIRQEGLVRPALIGHSMGGTWAMMVATGNPGLAGRVMVVDMMPFVGAMFGGPAATPQSVEPVAAGLRAQMAGASKTQRRAFTEATINGMVATASLRPQVLADSLASDPAVSAQAYYELVTTDLTADLSRLTMPLDVLYVTPAGAPVTDAQLDAFYAAAYAAVPDRKVLRVPGAAHFIMLDQPRVFADRVRTFLDR